MFKKAGIAYIAITFLITWGAWFTVAMLNHQKTLGPDQPLLFGLYVLGGFGPAIAAFVTRKLVSGKDEFKTYLKWYAHFSFKSKSYR